MNHQMFSSFNRLRVHLQFRRSPTPLDDDDAADNNNINTNHAQKTLMLRGKYSSDLVTWQGIFLSVIIVLVTHAIPKFSIPVVVFLSCYGRNFYQ